MQKKRANNGLVLLAGGGRKVQPIEVKVTENIYTLLLLSLQFPMQATSLEAILEIASDFTMKQHRDARYRGIVRGSRNSKGLGCSKIQEKEKYYIKTIFRYFVNNDSILCGPSPSERMEADKILRAGGF